MVEGYSQDNGWAIGAGEYTDLNYRDDVESRAIYDLLEQEIVPLFYNRTRAACRAAGFAHEAIHQRRLPRLRTNRMVQEYTEQCYWPSYERFAKLAEDNLNRARGLAQWRRGIARGWGQIKVEGVEANGIDPLHVGGELQVKARVNLGGLSPDDVEVQLFHGIVDSLGEIPNPMTVKMSQNGSREGSVWMFHGQVPCRSSGQHGFAVRVLPRHQDLGNAFEPGLVCWG